ncbi:hypothetical protein EQG49_04185 [Periweissella cryptocerci]|uniref:Uncharacterized protein n=1 Tax=Periweissella cryptocerci TaxID=2506420 RepID=A0A4P6YST1_9LACO|nr:hypothetical protein [Periweissella cryptocerci]QBO35716.1 hypothetical protein EQG49_04185 [Periweissella cryptocerci]
MFKYENETALQTDDFTTKQTSDFKLFLDKNNLEKELSLDSSKYLFVADSLGEDSSLDTMILLVDWLQKENITYSLFEISNRLNLKREINYSILRNSSITNKEISDEADYGLENDDDYWDAPFDDNDSESSNIPNELGDSESTQATGKKQSKKKKLFGLF